jgi:transcriptional regulator with XRE-family HTH domain
MPPEGTRGRTLKKAPDWWLRAVNAAFEHARKQNGQKLTKRALADKLGVSEFAIKRALDGSVPNIDIMNGLSDYFGLKRPVDIAAETSQPAPDVEVDQDAEDPRARLIRRNLIRLREDAGYDRFGAADATGIPFETLAKYESGELKVTLTDLELLATRYGHEVGHFWLETPPPTSLGAYDDLWYRRRQLEKLSPEARKEFAQRTRDAAMEIADREEFRAAKKAQLDHLKRAKERKTKG